MNDQRLFEMLTNVNDKLSNIDSNLARIDERTLNLNVRIGTIESQLEESKDTIVKLQNWQSRRDGNIGLRTKQVGWGLTMLVGLIGAFATLLTKLLSGS